jgi:hypothetical protein
VAGSKFRRKKTSTPQTEVTQEVETPEVSFEAPSVDHVAYDIVSTDGGRTFNFILIGYNLDEGAAAILATKSISRQIGLQFQNSKKALKTIAKIKES